MQDRSVYLSNYKAVSIFVTKTEERQVHVATLESAEKGVRGSQDKN
jgi:hypothetical protein